MMIIPRMAPKRDETTLRWPHLCSRDLVRLAFALRDVPLAGGPTIADISEQIALRERFGVGGEA